MASEKPNNNQTIKVCVRARPLSEKEIKKGNISCIDVDYASKTVEIIPRYGHSPSSFLFLFLFTLFIFLWPSTKLYAEIVRLRELATTQGLEEAQIFCPKPKLFLHPKKARI